MAYKEDPERKKARDKAYREANKERLKAYGKAWQEANREKCREAARKHREANREKERARQREVKRKWRAANRETHLERLREAGKKHRAANLENERARSRLYYANHPEQAQARAVRRRALKLSACPAWVDRKALLAIYEGCPPGHQVDHIAPLKGKNSCGLHVPWNLNYLPASENISKSNRQPQPGYFDWFSEPWTVHAEPEGRVWTPTNPEDE
jgi:hypothetical protein